MCSVLWLPWSSLWMLGGDVLRSLAPLVFSLHVGWGCVPFSLRIPPSFERSLPSSLLMPCKWDGPQTKICAYMNNIYIYIHLKAYSCIVCVYSLYICCCAQTHALIHVQWVEEWLTRSRTVRGYSIWVRALPWGEPRGFPRRA